MNDWWNDTESWGLILGVVSPLAIAIVQQPKWSGATRWVVGWGCAIVIGFLTCLARGDIGDGATLLRTIAVTLVASQAAYMGWRKGPVPSIERATSPSPAPGPDDDDRF